MKFLLLRISSYAKQPLYSWLVTLCLINSWSHRFKQIRKILYLAKVKLSLSPWPIIFIFLREIPQIRLIRKISKSSVAGLSHSTLNKHWNYGPFIHRQESPNTIYRLTANSQQYSCTLSWSIWEKRWPSKIQ